MDNRTLKNKENGLFYWRYNPAESNPVADKNNAADGDVLIAWALLKADARWHDKRYSAASDAITKALIDQRDPLCGLPRDAARRPGI
jgi:endoglucanase